MTNYSTSVLGHYDGFGTLEMDTGDTEPQDELGSALLEAITKKNISKILKVTQQADALKFKDEIDGAPKRGGDTEHTAESEMEREINSFGPAVSKDADLHLWLARHDFDAEETNAPKAQSPFVTLDLEYGF